MQTKSLTQFTQSELQTVLTLHNQLKEIEIFLVNEQRRLKEQIEPRVHHGLSDYELEIKVTYFLREDDPSYSDETDTMVAEYVSPFKHNPLSEEDFGVGSQTDHNDKAEWSRAFPDTNMCWLFHDLEDHHSLKWSDLLRIGEIWVEVIPILQVFYNVSE